LRLFDVETFIGLTNVERTVTDDGSETEQQNCGEDDEVHAA
jgi:hypothetical protein